MRVSKRVNQEDKSTIFSVNVPYPIHENQEAFKEGLQRIANAVKLEFDVENPAIQLIQIPEEGITRIEYTCQILVPKVLRGWVQMDLERLAFSEKQKRIDDTGLEYDGKRYMLTRRSLTFDGIDTETLRTVTACVKMTTNDKKSFYSDFNVQKQEDGTFLLTFYWFQEPTGLRAAL